MLSEFRKRGNKILYLADFMVSHCLDREDPSLTDCNVPGGDDGRGEVGRLDEVQAGGRAAYSGEGHEEHIPAGRPGQRRQHLPPGWWSPRKYYIYLRTPK